MKKLKEIKEAYTVGALLYSPALNDKIAESIIENKIKGKYSVSLCLEDSISDDSIDKAENQIEKTFKEIYENYSKELKLPKIFIRVRRPQQVLSLFKRLEKYQFLLSGFIFPKYSLECADEYNEYMKKINKTSEKPIYMMPILESSEIIELNTRAEYLYKIKEKIDEVSNIVLNIRVGGNDFCKEFNVRRHYDEMIYDITPVENILSDIVTVFSRDYVVSGPVWEYFSGKNEEWKKGLENEIKYDKLNGFIGKTVIHPNQIPVVNECLKVRKSDYEDAENILNWGKNALQVGKSGNGERMNEVKVHKKWAEEIKVLAEIYGVK